MRLYQQSAYPVPIARPTKLRCTVSQHAMTAVLCVNRRMTQRSPVIYNSDIANGNGPMNVWAGSDGRGAMSCVAKTSHFSCLVPRATVHTSNFPHQILQPPAHQPRTHDRVTSLGCSHRVDRQLQLRSSKKRCSVIISIFRRAVQRIIRVVALLGLPRPLANLGQHSLHGPEIDSSNSA